MLNLKILKNEEISDDLLKHIALFDKHIFPEGDEFAYPLGYLEGNYQDAKDALFVLLNNDHVVGYVNALFLSDENYNEYLKTKDFKKLKNIGIHDGENNMYFFTVALDPEIRHTACVKFLMYEFVHWLTSERLNGRKVTRTLCEVITDDGLRFIKKMGFVPINGGERDFGLYYAPDNLLNYMKTILEENCNLQDFNKLLDVLKSSSNLLDKFKDSKDAINYLVTKTGKSKSECELCYNFIKNLKLSEYEEKLERDNEEEFIGKVIELAKFYKLPVFAVTKNLTGYYNDNQDYEVLKARDNYLKDLEEELMSSGEK